MLASGIGYLEGRYPGISGDIVKYRHQRLPDGTEHLTVTLLIDDRAPEGDGHDDAGRHGPS